MRRILRFALTTTVATIAALGAAGAAGAAPGTPAPDTAARGRTVYAFALVTPNVASSPAGGAMAAAGDWISVTGGGTVDPATGAVHAGGGFVHHRADGTVHCLGTWTATALAGASGLGTRHATVSLVVTHYCATMGETHTGIPMTVTATGPAATGGVTVGEFTVPTRGAVLIAPWHR